jgi:CTP:molybdopterin cytidylyltransferase MocA
MPRTIPALLAVTAAAALAGCGSAGTSSESHVSPEAAKARVERAAHVKLVSQPVPDDAAEQGLRASYANAATVAKDRQAVALFLLDDPGVAEKVKDLVRGSTPTRARLIVHDEVLVVYAAAGRDRGDQVEKAVKAL